MGIDYGIRTFRNFPVQKKLYFLTVFDYDLVFRVNWEHSVSKF